MSKEAEWLLRELPTLVGKGLLDDATASRLRAHYQQATGQGLSWGMILLAIGGAALIGLGIILIFAHNWQSWTPELRVALSLLPLLVGQFACVQALRNGSRAWSESAGLFTALAIGASIALISQTYQFGGDLPRFILIWTLLALPLVYLLDASAVAALCWFGALGWALASADNGWWREQETLQAALRLPAFLLLASLPLPHLMRHIRLDRGSLRVAWLLRIALTVLVAGYAICTHYRQFASLFFVYAGMATAAALAGRQYFSGTRGLWGNPLFGAGIVGVCGMALLATMEPLWRELEMPWDTTLLPAAALALLTVVMAAARLRQSKSLLTLMLAALTPLLFLLASLGPLHAGVAALLGHLYVFALAAGLIKTGLQEARLGLANLGVTLIAALVMLRFFDSDLSYVVRGLGFIIVGVGFFAATVWLRRRLRRSAA